MANLSTASAVASIVVPGEQDPASLFREGKYIMHWGGETTRNFREVKVPHVTDSKLALPTLYLHFLHEDFCMQRHELDLSLRSGNDMSEVVLKLPGEYLSPVFARCCEALQDDVLTVIQALQSQGEMLVNDSDQYMGSTAPDTLYFSLKTARAKASVSLDKKAFGIPDSADQYLFVNNHASVVYFDDNVREAFNACIAGLPEMMYTKAKNFAIFLKVFYEGGFGYNQKLEMGEGYLPVNVGTAAMNVVPAFDGQMGIGTGYPYKLPAKFLPFTETVPISIDAIKSMSEFHGRYGLAFTRTLLVWEGDLWNKSRTLDFCSIAPHGGFYYVPASMKDHQQKGGLLYAFGESTSNATELSIQ